MSGSDHGQDDWIASQFPPDFKGHAVELGALDGLYLSNTLKLERQGWDVLCIEPNPRWFPELRQNRKLALHCACDEYPLAWAGVIEHLGVPGYTRTEIDPKGRLVPVMTLDQCLVMVGFPKLDLLCLDVDGIELKILRGLDLDTWKPSRIVVERCFGDDPQPYLEAHGYRLATTLDVDLCFVRE